MALKWPCRAYYNPNPFIGLCKHSTLLPVPLPPFWVPMESLHIDFDVVQGLWLGSFPSRGRGKKVIGDGLFLMGRTSDAGLIIPHISVPVPSWFNLVTTAFGSSNSIFGSSSVNLACKNILWGNQDCDIATTPFGPTPLSINLACFDPISMPTDLVVVWGTIYVGMSLGDLFACLAEIALQMLMDFALNKIGGAIGRKASKAWEATKSFAYKVMKKEVAGETATYAAKAIRVKATKEALQMSDEEFSQLARESGLSKKAVSAMEHLDEGIAKAAEEKGASRLDELVHIADPELKNVYDGGQELKSALKKDLEDAAEHYGKEGAEKAMKGVLAEDMKKLAAMRDAMSQSNFRWGIWVEGSGKKGLNMLRKQLLVYGNLLGGGTEGGLFSSDGAHFTDLFAVERRIDASWKGKIAQLIDGGKGDVEDWEDATIHTKSDDYYFDGDLSYSDGSSDSSSDSTDYWFDDKLRSIGLPV